MRHHDKYLNYLLNIARDIPSVAGSRHAACVVIKQELISVGVNKLKTDPFQMKFGKNDKSIFLHAEVHAIKNALRRVSVLDLRHATLYVVREKINKLSMSKPCAGCSRAILEFDFKQVVYSTDDGYEIIDCNKQSGGLVNGNKMHMR